MDVIQLALRSYSKLNPSHDTRLPISLPLLEKIISACDHTQSSVYSRKLTLAMYAMAFFAALRVGEITCRPNQPLRNVIFLNQIVFMKNREGVVSAIKVTLRNYKHSDPAVAGDMFSLSGETSVPCFYSACIFRAQRYLSGSPVLLAKCFANFSHIFH